VDVAEKRTAGKEKGPRLLGSTNLLKDLSREDLREVEDVCRYKTFRAGTQIFDRQAETRDIFFVVRGRVRIVNYSLSGREITLDDIREGGHFGELAAIDGQPRSAAVMAVEDSLIVALPHRYFLDVMRNHPAVAEKVMLDGVRMIGNRTIIYKIFFSH